MSTVREAVLAGVWYGINPALDKLERDGCGSQYDADPREALRLLRYVLSDIFDLGVAPYPGCEWPTMDALREKAKR